MSKPGFPITWPPLVSAPSTSARHIFSAGLIRSSCNDGTAEGRGGALLLTSPWTPSRALVSRLPASAGDTGDMPAAAKRPRTAMDPRGVALFASRGVAAPVPPFAVTPWARLLAPSDCIFAGNCGEPKEAACVMPSAGRTCNVRGVVKVARSGVADDISCCAPALAAPPSSTGCRAGIGLRSGSPRARDTCPRGVFGTRLPLAGGSRGVKTD